MAAEGKLITGISEEVDTASRLGPLFTASAPEFGSQARCDPATSQRRCYKEDFLQQTACVLTHPGCVATSRPGNLDACWVVFFFVCAVPSKGHHSQSPASIHRLHRSYSLLNFSPYFTSMNLLFALQLGLLSVGWDYLKTLPVCKRMFAI